jgi:hypothetical protein
MGGGTWPPTATYHDSWPLALKAYNSVFRLMEGSLPVEEASLDNAHNRKIIDSFRARMCFELERLVNMTEVEAALALWHSDNESFSTQSAWLGYYACISFLRHSYRCAQYTFRFLVSP